MTEVETPNDAGDKKTAAQMEMGIVSKLITDMTLKGATEAELTRAIRHSMVVIDAEKHKLDYKQSEVVNDIDTLKNRWQQNPNSSKGYGIRWAWVIYRIIV